MAIFQRKKVLYAMTRSSSRRSCCQSAHNWRPTSLDAIMVTQGSRRIHVGSILVPHLRICRFGKPCTGASLMRIAETPFASPFRPFVHAFSTSSYTEGEVLSALDSASTGHFQTQSLSVLSQPLS
jgi:hypothetical protein